MTLASTRRVDDPTSLPPGSGNDDGTTLLTLPLCDLKKATTATGSAATGSGGGGVDGGETLVLMQLPPPNANHGDGLSVSDLMRGKSTCFLVGAGPNDNDDEEDEELAGASSATTRRRQACLVVESSSSEGGVGGGGKSFLLSHLETSNSLILVPPPPSAPITASAGSADLYGADAADAHGDECSPTKKRARLLLEGHVQHGRLVNPSTFLELRRTRLDRGRLRDVLLRDRAKQESQRNSRRNTYRKKKKNGKRKERELAGCALSALAKTLQSSRSEVLAALADLNAFQIPTRLSSSSENEGDDGGDDGDVRYTFLPEETVQESMNAIIAVLSEKYGGDEDVFDRIPVAECVREAEKVLDEDGAGNYGGARGDDEFQSYSRTSVVRHCLVNLCCSPDDTLATPKACDVDVVKIDMSKVALYLAHRLFQTKGDSKRSWPAEEFLAEWSNLLPGVGSSFRPTLDILRGVALKEEHEGGEGAPDKKDASKGDGDDAGEEKATRRCHLRYFPEGRLPSDAASRFSALFSRREEWEAGELEPYIRPLVAGGGCTATQMTDLLLQHSRAVAVDCGSSGTRQVYRSR